MEMKNEAHETPDIALASYLFCSGTQLVSIDRQNPRRCIFIFESPKTELISQWQEGTANVNALAFYNAFQTLKAKIFEDER